MNSTICVLTALILLQLAPLLAVAAEPGDLDLGLAPPPERIEE